MQSSMVKEEKKQMKNPKNKTEDGASTSEMIEVPGMGLMSREAIASAAAKVQEQAAKRAAYNKNRVLTDEQKAARLAHNKEYRATHPLTEDQKAKRLEYGKTRRETAKAILEAAKAAGIV